MAVIKYKNPTTGEYEPLLLPTLDSLPIGSIIEYDGDNIPGDWEEITETNEIFQGTKLPTTYTPKLWIKTDTNTPQLMYKNSSNNWVSLLNSNLNVEYGFIESNKLILGVVGKQNVCYYKYTFIKKYTKVPVIIATWHDGTSNWQSHGPINVSVNGITTTSCYFITSQSSVYGNNITTDGVDFLIINKD